MKMPTKIFVGICAFGFGASLFAQTTTPSQSLNPATQLSPDGFSEQQILQSWGWIIAHDSKVDHVDISDAELSTFLKGVAEGYRGEKCPYYFFKITPDVDKLAKARRQKYVQAVTEKNEAIAAAFFAELDKNPNVVKLPGGLRYEITRPGSGPCPKPQQTINIHFTEHLLDGTEFAQMGPGDLVFWPNRVNKPLYEALPYLNKGGSIRIFVPPPPTDVEIEMAGVPPGSAVVYEAELFDLKETPADVLSYTIVPDAPTPDPPPPSGYSPDQIMETWGWSAVRRTPVFHFGMNQAELDAITDGLVSAMKGRPPVCDLDKIQPDIDKLIADRRQQAWLQYKEKQTAEMTAFFAKIDQEPGVVKLPSGLRYRIIKPGSGPYPKAGKTVTIGYVGHLLSGKVFERTEEGDSVKVELDDPPGNWPIPGWYEGLQKISKGGKITLYIPPALAYGDEGASGIPPCSTLIYEIEVIDVSDTPVSDQAAPTSQPTASR
jgi:FKBP-type peptidyl-prolyl cis-trans isomerase